MCVVLIRVQNYDLRCAYYKLQLTNYSYHLEINFVVLN